MSSVKYEDLLKAQEIFNKYGMNPDNICLLNIGGIDFLKLNEFEQDEED